MAMAMSISNHIKAVLFPGNINDDERSILKDNCLTVQHFSYTCDRNRDDAGFPQGPTLPTGITFVLRLLHPNDSKVFYTRLTDNDPHAYTFIFNASYGQNGRIASYDDALLVNGYVVDVEDSFCTQSAADGYTEQMLITVKMLVNSLTYKGKENDKVLMINNKW